MNTAFTELGERVDDAIRAENYGLTSQRLTTILDRMPASGWALEYENGVPVRGRFCWGWTR